MTQSNKQIIKFVRENTPNAKEIEDIVNFDNNSNGYENRELLLKKQTVICRKTENGKTKALHRVFSHAALKQYIIQDDLKHPYNTMKPDIKNGILIGTNTDDKWYISCIVAPLYKRMHIDAKQARKVIDHILMSKLGPTNKGVNADNCIVVRLFLASSKNLQAHRVMTIQNPGVRNLHRSTPYPKFVWVAELYDIAQYPGNEAFGEIILDATNAEGVGLESVIMINYNSRHLTRNRDGVNITRKDTKKVKLKSFDFGIFTAEDECTYEPYNHNLTRFLNTK